MSESDLTFTRGSEPVQDLELERPVVLIGAGAMGRAFGVLLTSAGVPTTLYLRELAAQNLAEQGKLSVIGAVDRSVPVATGPGSVGVLGLITDAGQIPNGAGLIFTTKGPALPGAVESVSHGMAAAGNEVSWVAGLQNGVVKDDVLSSTWGPKRVILMASTLNSRVEESGAAFVAGYGNTYVGRRTDTDESATTLYEALQRVQVPISLLGPEEIRSLVWMKCVNAIGIFGVGCLTRLPGNVAFTRPGLVQAYLDLVREAAAVCAAEGVVISDFPGMPIRTRLEQDDSVTVAEMVADTMKILSGPNWFSSMGQDVIAGRPTEVATVFGDLVERASRLGVDVPRLMLTCQVISGLQP